MQNIFLFITAIILIVPNTWNILRYDYLLTQKDTRMETKEWVGQNIVPSSKIGQDAYTGELSDVIFYITKKFTLSDTSFNYYSENSYQYLIVSNTQYNRYLAEPNKNTENVKFYKKLFSEGELIKEFRPRGDLWPKPNERFLKYHIHISPTIRIYCIE